MIKRWIIRGLTLTLVLCVLTAWLASYWVTALLVHYVSMGPAATGQNGFLAIRTGQMSFLREGPLLSADWQASLASNTVTDWWVPEFLHGYSAASKVRFLGFDFYNAKDQFVSIPLWFPTLLFGLFLWFVWRKTRLKPVGRAFPIETTNYSARAK